MLDPASASASELYSAITTESPNYYTSTYISGFSSTGWKSFALSSDAINNLQSSGLSSDYFTIGFYEYETSSYNLHADGYNGTNRPYIEVTYTINVPTPIITQATPYPQCGIGNAILTASIPVGESIPSGYEFHWYSNSACTTEITSGVSGTNNNTLTYPIDNDGTQVWCRLEGATEEVVRDFDYTGSVIEYAVPSGTSSLQMQVWGAQGGSYSSTYSGGKGGYAVGTLNNPSGTLYVVVGGQGTSVSASTSGGSGGYNGGGAGGAGSSSSLGIAGSGGGGATHIATATGLLSSLSSNTSSVLQVTVC